MTPAIYAPLLVFQIEVMAVKVRNDSKLQKVLVSQSVGISIAPIWRLQPYNRGRTRVVIPPGRPHIDSDDDMAETGDRKLTSG